MLCKADGHSRQCKRCQTAKAHCNYSEPRKPGRPSTNAGNVVIQGVSANVEPTESSEEASLPPEASSVDDETWMQDMFHDNGISQGIRQFSEVDIGSWSVNGLFNGYSDASYLQLDQPESVAAKSLPLHIIHLPLSSPTTGDVSMNENTQSKYGTASDLQPPSPDSGQNSKGYVDQDYVKQLADFQVGLADSFDFETHVSPAKLGQAAAYVLESSATFLKLIQVPAAATGPQIVSCIQTCLPPLQEAAIGEPKHDRSSRNKRNESQSHSPFAWDTSILLQLISLSMRMAELHYWLYTSIYRYLQQDPNMLKEDTAGGCGRKSAALPLSFSIAGVELAPHPHFQLHILLQTGTHYLSRIQKTLSELEGLGSDGTSLRLPSVALPMRMLISEDQETRMAKIWLVLAKLKDEFGIGTHL